MDLRDGENLIIKVRAETMYFNFIRRGSYFLSLTNQRIVLHSLFGIKEQFELRDIESFECYKVTIFLPFGLRIKTKDGKKLEVAIMNRKTITNELSQFCPEK